MTTSKKPANTSTNAAETTRTNNNNNNNKNATPEWRHGRPSGVYGKLTPELQKRICDLLENGHFVSTVCNMVNISRQSFYVWQRENPEFGAATKAASTKIEDVALNSIVKAMKEGDGKLALEFLSRKYPNKWGKTKSTEVSVKMTNDELRSILKPDTQATTGSSNPKK